MSGSKNWYLRRRKFPSEVLMLRFTWNQLLKPPSRCIKKIEDENNRQNKEKKPVSVRWHTFYTVYNIIIFMPFSQQLRQITLNRIYLYLFYCYKLLSTHNCIEKKVTNFEKSKHFLINFLCSSPFLLTGLLSLVCKNTSDKTRYVSLLFYFVWICI